MATKVTSLAIGGSYAASFAALLTAGSVLFGGPRYTDPTQVAYDASCYGTGCTVKVEATLTASGANRMGATLSIPSAVIASGAYLDRLSFECRGMGNAKKITAAITQLSKNGTGGTAIPNFTQKAAGTGSTAIYSTGAMKLFRGNYITLLTTSGAATTMNGDCKLKATMSAIYGD